jgi:hypothetical protein
MKSPEIEASVRRVGPRLWVLLATAVLLLAAVFRLAALTRMPPGLAQDEVLDADIALFIRGGEHALFFRHGYGHEPLYHYWAAPFQAFLGDNALSIRLPAAILGLLLVALTLRWARRDYGSLAALAAGFGLAVSWWPIIFSRIGIRPIMMPVLLLLAVLWWPLRARTVTRRACLSAAVAGLWLGLSIYSYTAARVAPLIPLFLLGSFAAHYALPHRQARRPTEPLPVIRAQMIYAAIVLGVCLLAALPLALTLRANPDLQQRVEQLGGPLTALRQGNPRPVLEAMTATLGVFSFTGDPRWTYSLPHRPLFDPLTAILFYVGLGIALWRWRRPTYALLSLWLLAALLPSALSPDAPSTVRLVGALPVVYLLPGLALAAAERSLSGVAIAQTPQVRARLLLILLALLGVNIYRTVRDGFTRWPAALETRLRYQSTLSDIARHWRASAGTLVVADGFYEPIDGDSLARAGGPAGARWVQSGQGAGGAVIWPNDGRPAVLYVPEYASLDPELSEAAGIDLEQPAYRSPGPPSFAVYPLSDGPAALSAANSPFGEPPLITLRGHALLDPATPITGALHLVTWWQVEGVLPADLAIFVHLLDESGGIVAQSDGLDAAAATLRPGDRFLQRHVLLLPPGDHGPLTLVAGLYSRNDGTRLPAGGGDSVMLWHCEWANGYYCRPFPGQ